VGIEIPTIRVEISHSCNCRVKASPSLVRQVSAILPRLQCRLFEKKRKNLNKSGRSAVAPRHTVSPWGSHRSATTAIVARRAAESSLSGLRFGSGVPARVEKVARGAIGGCLSVGPLCGTSKGVGACFRPLMAARRPAAREDRPEPARHYLCQTKPSSIPRDEAVSCRKGPCLTAVCASSLTST